MPTSESITIQGRGVRITGGDGAAQQGETARFVEAIYRASVRGFDDLPLPHNVAWKVDAGPLTICILELEPALRRLDIVAPDSPAPYGPSARYVGRRLATPYVVLKVPFLKGVLVPRCELFYRNEPLRHVDDPLFWSNLLNVSPNAYSCRAWICTQYLYSRPPSPGVVAGLDALLKHLWGAGNNRSSEANEGASCFSRAVAENLDQRVISFDRWEQESIKDPRFVLDVPWRPVGLSVRELIEAELQYHRVKRDLGATAELVNIFLGANGRAASSNGA